MQLLTRMNGLVLVITAMRWPQPIPIHLDGKWRNAIYESSWRVCARVSEMRHNRKITKERMYFIDEVAIWIAIAAFAVYIIFFS